jgi:hypothetical protein
MTTILPFADLVGRRAGDSAEVPTFVTRPVGGVGAQLFPGGLATSTPQAFLVASRPVHL